MGKVDSNYKWLRLDEIALADIRSSKPGLPLAASFTTIANIAPDSAMLMIEQPGKTDLMVEDSDFPWATLNTPGEKYIEFATRDMKAVLFGFGLGGTTGATYWKAPIDAVTITQKAVKARTKSVDGHQATVKIYNATLRSGFDGNLSKSDSGKLTFRLEINKPIAAKTDSPIYVSWS